MASKKTEVAETNKNTALAIPDYGDKLVGVGWENTDKSDFQIPFLNQLQALSPMCVKGTPAYRADVDPGMFFNSVSETLYKGAVNILPVITKHVYIERTPKAQGAKFVAEHALDSAIVTAAKAKATDQLNLLAENGNSLVETYQVFALILNEDGTEMEDKVVISFNKTKIKRYKQFMTRLRTFKGSQRIPLFAHRLVMAATDEKNGAGQPYKNVSVKPLINNDVAASLLPGDSPLLEIASGFLEGLKSGAVKADHSTDATATTTSEEEGGDGVFAD